MSNLLGQSSPDVRGLHETGGMLLHIGTIGDGQVVKRVGDVLMGVSVPDGISNVQNELWLRPFLPDDSLGINGDEWLDTNTYDLYRKENGTFY